MRRRVKRADRPPAVTPLNDKPEKCGDKGPAGYVCEFPKGHTGLHGGGKIYNFYPYSLK